MKNVFEIKFSNEEKVLRWAGIAIFCFLIVLLLFVVSVLLNTREFKDQILAFCLIYNKNYTLTVILISCAILFATCTWFLSGFVSSVNMKYDYLISYIISVVCLIICLSISLLQVSYFKQNNRNVGFFTKFCVLSLSMLSVTLQMNTEQIDSSAAILQTCLSIPFLMMSNFALVKLLK